MHEMTFKRAHGLNPQRDMLTNAMRLLAATCSTTAGYWAIRQAADVICHNEMVGQPDTPTTRLQIDQGVAAVMREYEAMGGLVPPIAKTGLETKKDPAAEAAG